MYFRRATFKPESSHQQMTVRRTTRAAVDPGVKYLLGEIDMKWYSLVLSLLFFGSTAHAAPPAGVQCPCWHDLQVAGACAYAPEDQLRIAEVDEDGPVQRYIFEIECRGDFPRSGTDIYKWKQFRVQNIPSLGGLQCHVISGISPFGVLQNAFLASPGSLEALAGVSNSDNTTWDLERTIIDISEQEYDQCRQALVSAAAILGGGVE